MHALILPLLSFPCLCSTVMVTAFVCLSLLLHIFSGASCSTKLQLYCAINRWAQFWEKKHALQQLHSKKYQHNKFFGGNYWFRLGFLMNAFRSVIWTLLPLTYNKFSHCASTHLAIQLLFAWWRQSDCDRGWQRHNKCSSVNASVVVQ